MIREAEVYLLADEAAVGVFGQVKGEQWASTIPPVFDMPGADQPVELRKMVNHFAYDDSWVPDMLAGRTMDEVGRETFDGDLLGDDPDASLTRIKAAAADAARKVSRSGDGRALLVRRRSRLGLLLAAQHRPDPRRARRGRAHRRRVPAHRGTQPGDVRGHG